jgi:hypothetical protein
MKPFVRRLLVLTAVAMAGCASVDGVDDYFGQRAQTRDCWAGSGGSGLGAAILYGPLAALQILYDASQGF